MKGIPSNTRLVGQRAINKKLLVSLIDGCNPVQAEDNCDLESGHPNPTIAEGIWYRVWGKVGIQMSESSNLTVEIGR